MVGCPLLAVLFALAADGLQSEDHARTVDVAGHAVMLDASEWLFSVR